MTATEPVHTVFDDIAITAIKPHPRNPRRQLGNLAELADSIRAQGLLQPVVVAPGKNDGVFTLIAGHRRHAAAKKAGISTVPCLIRQDLITDADQLQAMLTENLQRADLNPIEEGDAYQALLDLDLKVKDISSTTGSAQKRIRERVKLAASPEDLRERVTRHEVTLEDALTLQAYAKDSAAYDRLIAAVGTQNWKWAVAAEERDAKRRREVGKVRSDLIAEGVDVVEIADLSRLKDQRHANIGGEWRWAHLGSRPEDAVTSADVVATIPTYGDVAPVWYRLTLAGAATANDNDESGDDELDIPVGPAADRPVDPDADARRVAEAKLDSDLKTAGAVRRNHLYQAVAEGDPKVAHRAAIASFAAALVECGADELRFVGRAMGITPPTDQDGDGDWDAFEKAILARAETYSIEQLVILHRLTETHDTDTRLDEPRHWSTTTWNRIELDEWRTEIVEVFGYAWSDVEARQLAALAAADSDDE